MSERVMDEAQEQPPPMYDDANELKELLGMFDVPAFARRGLDLEYAIKRLHDRLGRERDGMLDMVRVRLKQWAAVTTGPDDFRDVFKSTIEPLYLLAKAEPPRWVRRPASPRNRLAAASDLVASVARFNRRWLHALETLKLDSMNRQIDDYNRYYVLEKECVLGSSRLALRNFVPEPRMVRERLLADYPTLPAPERIV